MAQRSGTNAGRESGWRRADRRMARRLIGRTHCTDASAGPALAAVRLLAGRFAFGLRRSKKKNACRSCRREGEEGRLFSSCAHGTAAI